jgi:dihydroneopterin aldolase
MNALMEIEIQKVRFFGFHGLHAGEEIIGGEYEVSLVVCYKPDDIIISKIGDTIDYTALFSIVKQRMQTPTQLLETIATTITSEIIAKFQRVTDVRISIYKLHPPIESFEGSVGVTYSVKR